MSRAFKYNTILSQDKKRWEMDKTKVVPVTFLEFSVWGDGGSTSPCAIVELENGEIEVIHTDYLTFKRGTASYV